MLQGKHITFSYPEPAKGKTDVLADVSFEIREHDFIGLIGASGSGKTTLIKHLNGLLKAESGEILFKGENIYSKKYPVSELRKKVGLVFQYPEQQLFGRTILKDVMYGPLNLGMSEEDAIQEYLLSNIYLKESNDELCQQLQIPEKLREECRPLLYVQRELIEIMIQSIRVKYRSYDEFLLQEYNFDNEKRRRLKEIYCE